MVDRMTSQLLYRYLCEKVGTEKVVKARRIFFKVKDCSENSAPQCLESISSGSKAEGLDLPGSDFDIMLMDLDNVVHTEHSGENYSPGQDYKLVMDTKNTPPGFTNIIVRFPSLHTKDKFICICDSYEVELFETVVESILPNTALKTIFLTGAATYLGEMASDTLITHGPCSSAIDGSCDMMFCFRLDNWPREALEWLSRSREHDWPPEDLISNIVNEEKSVLLVPIGSKFGSAEDNPHEWRISFSVAEQMLIHSFNHTQILCYALLKLLLKQVIDSEAKGLLCSYFMKTLVFWLIEESGVSVWTSDNLFKCFQACLRRLIYHVKLGFFPNYFIVQNNMFEGKIFGETQTHLYDILHNIYTEGINVLLRIDTFNDFLVSSPLHQICRGIDMKYHAEDRAIYPLIRYLNRPLYRPTLSIYKIYFCLKACKTNLTKSLFAMHLVKECLEAVVNKTPELAVTNKRCYLQCHSSLPYFVLGTNFNLNGWLLLAALFYQNKQYYDALKVIDFVCSEAESKPNNIHALPIACNERYTFLKEGSFLQRCKLVCNIPVDIIFEDGTVFEKCDFQNDQDIQSCYFDESICRFGHFLRFMCFHHLHDIEGRDGALSDFQRVVDNTILTIDISYCTSRLINNLLKAYIISDKQCPRRNFVKAKELIQIMLDHPLCSNLIARICNSSDIFNT